MENKRLQSELEDLRSRFGITLDQLTADEIAAYVDCCRRIDNPYSAANDSLLDPSVEVNGTRLYPLTIGASVWLDEYANRWWGSQGKSKRYFWALAYAMVHAREPEAFTGATTEGAATRRIMATCIRFAFSIRSLKAAMDKCLASRPEWDVPDRRDYEEGATDWSRIIARLESQSGIRREEWIWGRTARHCLRAYIDLCRYAKESGMGKASRVRDELDDAINSLARLKKSIKDRIKREQTNG